MFDHEEFSEILRRIKAIDLQKKNAEGEDCLAILDHNSLFEVASIEETLGGDLSNIGFPNKKKELLVKANPVENMCILSKSKNKEGAIAVLEYILYSPGEGLIGEENPLGGRGYAWSLIDLFEADADAAKVEIQIMEPTANGEDYVLTKTIFITDHEVEIMKEWMSHAKVETARDHAIREIVMEEVKGSFLGQKSLENTCDVIQRRVQLLLDESR